MIARALVLGLTTLFLASSAGYAAGPANPSRTGVYLELDGMFIIEDFSTTPGRIAAKSGTSGAFGFRAGWRPARPVAFEISYERIFNLYQKNDANIIMLSGKYLLLVDRPYQPFIRTGFGSIFGKLPSARSRRPGSSQSSFVWKIGAGLDYVIDDHLTASLYGDYVIPTEEFHLLNYGSIGFGLRYKF